MYRTTTFLLSVVIFNVFVDSLPSPQNVVDTNVGQMENRADKIIDVINQHVIDEERNMYNFMSNISFKGLCNSKYCLISDHNDGPNIHKKTSSQTTVDDGKSVTVNETTWTSDDGKRLSVYQVDVDSKAVNPPEENEAHTSKEEASPGKQPFKFIDVLNGGKQADLTTATDNEPITSTAPPTTASVSDVKMDTANVATWTNKDGKQFDVYNVYVPKTEASPVTQCHNCPGKNLNQKIEEGLIDYLRNNSRKATGEETGVEAQPNPIPEVPKETTPIVSDETTTADTQTTVAKDEDKPLDIFHLLLGKTGTDFDTSQTSAETKA